MKADRQSADDEEAQTRQLTRSVRNFSDGVFLLATALVENAQDAARRGDVDAEAFLREWRSYFADRHHVSESEVL